MSLYHQERGGIDRRNERRSMGGMHLIGSGLMVLGGLAAGAAVMYLLDPDEGSSRRGTIRKGASGMLHGLGDRMSSAYESAAETAGSLRDRASSLASRATDMVGHEAEEEDEGISSGTMLGLILGGCASAALLYLLTSEYESIRRGDFSGAVSHAYGRASDAVSDVANRTSEYFTGESESPASPGQTGIQM